jgi:hypothetical protein
MEKMNSALGFLEVGGNLKPLKDQDGVERVYVQDEDGKLTCLGTIEEYERSKPLIEAFCRETSYVVEYFGKEIEKLFENKNKDIELGAKDAYQAVGEYIERYWKRHGYTSVVVCMETSDDGKKYVECNVFASPDLSPSGFGAVEYDYDWWEGEKYVRISGIRGLHEMRFVGGVYEDQ